MMDTRAVKTESVFLTGAEGNRLAATVYLPDPLENDEKKAAPPVLFMHGGGQTRHSWAGPAQQVASRGRVAVTVDARGHGDSDWLENKNYTFPHYSDDLRHLVTEVDQKWGDPAHPSVLVGASMGGISAMLAQSEGGNTAGVPLFSAIVLVDITPRMARSGVNKIMNFMADGMRDGFASLEEAADAVAAYMPNRKRPKSTDGLKKNLRQREDGRWIWHWDPAFVDGERNITSDRAERTERFGTLTEAASKISVPTLLVRGSKSELVTKEAAEEFLELVPHAKYVDVTDAGHMVAGDKNDIFADAVFEFLEGAELI